MAVTETTAHTWTRDEYYRMAAVGLFEGRRVELVEGQVIEMPPMSSPHITSVTLVAGALQTVLPAGYFVRVQGPLSLGGLSDPEPDVAIIAGDVRQYAAAHPWVAALVVEVADTSLRYDRTDKADLYARHGVPEYWIANLPDRQIEVYRDPTDAGYRSREVHSSAASVSPLVAPETSIRVVDLLP